MQNVLCLAVPSSRTKGNAVNLAMGLSTTPFVVLTVTIPISMVVNCLRESGPNRLVLFFSLGLSAKLTAIGQLMRSRVICGARSSVSFDKALIGLEFIHVSICIKSVDISTLPRQRHAANGV